MFTHLSLQNKYHLYKFEDDKVIRDDYKFTFSHPDLIKADYIPLPNLNRNEVKAVIIELRNLPEYKDMVRAFYFNIEPTRGKIEYIPKIRGGEKTECVKELLKFIKRDFDLVI